jgi:hypothetical protein
VIALSPVLSWLVVLVVLFVALVVYAAVVMGGRADDEWQRIRWERRNGGGVISFPPETSRQEVESFIQVFGGIYDHEARGDFHNPIRDHEWCDDCNARLRRAFNQVADLDLGPRDADALMASIQKALES